MLLYFCFLICKRIKIFKFINVYLMVLLLSISCICFSKYRKYSVKFIFASEFTVTFIRVEVMPVLGQWQLIKCLLSALSNNRKSWIISKCSQVTITCSHSACSETFMTSGCWRSGVYSHHTWCPDKTCIMSLFCHSNIPFPCLLILYFFGMPVPFRQPG